ncbi:MAG: hypothetical protein H8E40_00935 [Chloroflexi bacterium]|nr:hypothetical protein [Chloroflexota bacterium]
MTTLLTLREKVGKKVAAYNEITTTTAGESDGTTIVSTDLMRFEDDVLAGNWVKITTGSTLETRQIEHNYTPSGTVKVYKPFTAQIATAMTAEIYDFNPTDLDDCINDAIADAYPDICKPIRDYSLVTNNLIVNGRFADWAVTTAPDYWTTSVSTLTQETSEIRFGAYSIKVLNAGYAYLSSDDWPILLSLQDSTQDFYVWAKTDVASTAKLQIYTKTEDGTETTSAGTGDALHSGGDEWEELKEEDVSIPDDLARIEIRLVVVGAETAYFTNVYAPGTIYDFVIPSQLDIVMQAKQCNAYDKPYTSQSTPLDFYQFSKEATRYIRFDDASSGKTIELIGYGSYPELSSDTDTIDLSPGQERSIVYGAIANLLRKHGTTISSQSIDEVLKLAAMYDAMSEKHRTSKAVAPFSHRGSSL